jgi:hypothetical protein
MSEYMIVMSACFGCKQVFSYNADRVPSIRINGEREPICRDCVARVNPKRAANGLAAIVILPGAYDPEEVA